MEFQFLQFNLFSYNVYNIFTISFPTVPRTVKGSSIKIINIIYEREDWRKMILSNNLPDIFYVNLEITKKLSIHQIQTKN